MANSAGRKTYTRRCEYCDTDYTTTAKPYRGNGQVFDSCSKTACVTACTEAYNAAREQVAAERSVLQANQPREPRQYVATDWNYLVAMAKTMRK